MSEYELSFYHIPLRSITSPLFKCFGVDRAEKLPQLPLCYYPLIHSWMVALASLMQLLCDFSTQLRVSMLAVVWVATIFKRFNKNPYFAHFYSGKSLFFRNKLYYFY